MDSAVDWTPVDLLISQLMEVYDPHEDAETIQESLSTLNSERDVFRHAEETLRGLEKDLQNEVTEQEESMELSRVIEEQQQQVDKLNKEKEDARKNLNSIRNDIASKEADIKKAEAEYMELVKKCAEAQKVENQTKTKIKNVFVLYHELSKITWDYDSSKIKGVMSRMKFNDVIDFEFDPEGKSEYEIANTLWDLMEGEEAVVLYFVYYDNIQTNIIITPHIFRSIVLKAQYDHEYDQYDEQQ